MFKLLKNRGIRNLIFSVLIGVIFCVNGCGKESEVESNVAYEIDKRETIVRNANGGKVAEISFESPVFEDEKYAFITESLEAEKENYFNKYEEGFLESVYFWEESDYRDGYFPYYCTSKIQSVFQKDNYVCVLTQQDWYVGGIMQCDLVGYNYSLETGKKISLQEISGLDTDALLYKIQKGLIKQNLYYEDTFIDSLLEYENKEIPFYFDCKGVYAVFPEGSISYMSSGCIVVPIK